MKPNFTGPSYTLGIEEELMIVDRESWDLVNAIEDLLADSGAPSDGEGSGIKPELHESVLEIATKPCADTREAGASCAACAARWPRSRRAATSPSAPRARTRSRAGRTSASRPGRATAT